MGYLTASRAIRVTSWSHHFFSNALFLLAILFLPALVDGEGEVRGKMGAGDTIDTAPFGQKLSGHNFIGVQWDNPRDVYEVRVVGVDQQVAESLHLEWWGSVWNIWPLRYHHALRFFSKANPPKASSSNVAGSGMVAIQPSVKPEGFVP